jgi:hypothetical protein
LGRAEVLNDVDAIENVVHSPRTVHVPDSAKSQASVGVLPGSDGRSGIVGIVFGYEIFAGEVVTQGPDDLGDGCGVDGLYGVEPEPVDTEVAQIHAGIVKKEVFDLSLPGCKAFTPGSVMAVDVVDAAGYSVIAEAVAVI